MGWLERNVERRCDPREVLAGCRSVVSLALNYLPSQEQARSDYRIARYSWNDDYHDLIEDKLKDLDLALQDMGGTQRYYVDTGPVLERDFASASGLAASSGGARCTLGMEPDATSSDHCGKCTACITACPTQAITAPRKLAATRCISYLTIEHKGAIPLEFRRAIGDRIYGCDDCLDACPWNRFAQISREVSFHAREEIFTHSLSDFLDMSVDDFRRVFAKSPIKRIKHERFLRNVCVALGNTGTEKDLSKLKELATHESPLIAEHAQWAIEEIMNRNSLS